jgi:hypothetical protein
MEENEHLVCRPMQTKSLGGASYIVTFIDDFSRKTMVNILKQKNQVLNKFKEYKIIVEKKKGKLLKTLRLNNGNEYISNAFNQFCRNNGITKQLTKPYTLEQNGVIEWKNRSLQECVRSMLKQLKLLDYFWAKAIGTIVYLQNKTLTKVVVGKTLKEMWTCKTPYVAHLKVFGCQAYDHVPKQKRQKLDSKSKECIFIGYTKGEKRYKLLKEKTKIYFIARM